MRSIIICVLFTAAIKTSAQINIICPKLIDTTLNYFYIGVDNPIKVVGKNVSDNNIVSISGGGASLTKISANNYIVRATTITDDCRIVIIEKTGKVILKKDFKVKVIGDLVAGLDGLRDTTLSKSRILLNPFLSITIPGCYYKMDFQIISFMSSFDIERDSIINTIATGNFLTPEQIDLVKKAESGSMITFEDLKVIGPDGRTRKLVPFLIKIQ